MTADLIAAPPDLDGLNYPLFTSEVEYFFKESVFKMVKTLNNCLPFWYREREELLQQKFEKAWPLLQDQLSDIIKQERSNLPCHLLEYNTRKIQQPMGHRFLFTTFGAERISESPFCFVDLILQCKQRILIAGHNLYTLAGKKDAKLEETHKKAIFDALRNKRSVDIMLCNVGCDEAVRLWGQEVMHNVVLYKEHLEHSKSVFNRWLREANTMNLNGLTVKTIPMVPLGITFVDPKDVDGRLVLTPAIYERKEAAARPCYLILKRIHRDVFNYYWDAYEWAFDQLAT